MKSLKQNLKWFGITHKEVADEVGMAQSTVTQLLNEELLSRVKLGAEALIDKKVGKTQHYQNERLEEMKAQIKPTLQ